MKIKSHILLFMLIILLSLLCFSGCTIKGSNKETGGAPVRIATINGPTGIGMVEMMTQPSKYEITVYQNPDELIGKVITGEVDAASLPANVGAVLYNKTEGQILAVSPVTLGVLYIVQNVNDSAGCITSVSDLRGKTILASGKGSSPEYILDHLLKTAGIDPQKDVSIKWLTSHTEVNAALLTEQDAIAMLPEPFVSIAAGKSPQISVALDLNQAWSEATGNPLAMSVFIVQKSFAEQRGEDLALLIGDYQKSVAFVNENPNAPDLVAEKGLLADAALARQAIPKCRIVFYTDRNEGASLLKAYYETLFAIDPKSVGGQPPNEDFYL